MSPVQAERGPKPEVVIPKEISNHLGNGERKLYNTKELWGKPTLTADDIRALWLQDQLELQKIHEMGIEPEDVYQFMRYLLLRGYSSPNMKVVDGVFRVFTNRRIFKYRSDDWGCPVIGCRHKIKPNLDIFFHPSSNQFYPDDPNDEERLSHKPFRINDAVVHLAKTHAVWEKGLNQWDQCYPTSPLDFVNGVYIPWLNKMMPSSKKSVSEKMLKYEPD